MANKIDFNDVRTEINKVIYNYFGATKYTVIEDLGNDLMSAIYKTTHPNREEKTITHRSPF